MNKLNREEFRALRAQAEHDLAQSREVPSILICAGTGCIAGGAMKIYHDIAGEPTETVVPILKNPDGVSLFDMKIRSFLDASMNGTPSPVPSSQILYNQAILSGIATSSDLGHEIKIEIPEI